MSSVDAQSDTGQSLEYHITVHTEDERFVSDFLVQQTFVLNDAAGVEQTLVSQELADNVSVTSENQPDHELSSLLTCSAEDGMVGAAAASLVALEHIIDEDTDTDTESIQSHESNDNHSDMPNLASLVHLRHRLVKMSRRLSIAPNAGPSLHTRSDDHTLPNISEQDSETPDSGSFNEQLFTPPGRSVDAFSPVSKIGSPFARLAHHVRRASFASHKPDLTSVVAMAQQHETERLPVLGRRPSMALLRVAVDSNIADSPAMSRAGSVTADHSTPAKANPHAELTSLLSASSLALQHRLARFEALIEALPPPGSPGRSFRINWVWHVLQNHGVCTVDFAAQVNRAVHLIDIRTEEEVCGPSGHIAGSSWFPLSDLHTLPSLLPSSNCPVVIIAQFEDDARLACAELERLGLTYIAPMQGGIVAWRLYGFSCARDSTLLSQRGKLRPRPLLEDMEVVNTVTSHHPRRHSVDHSHRRRPSIYSPTAAASTAHNESIDFELVRQTSQSQDAVTLADIKRHVGDPNSLRWLKLSAFTLHESMSCVDGRNDDAVVGTPGGDIGELALVLSVAEDLCGIQLNDSQVETLFKRRVDELGRVYCHTDSQALDTLSAHMLTDPRLATAMTTASASPFTFRLFMRSPPEDIRPVLLEHMLMPSHLGCGHIRLMVQNPEQYAVRADLTLSILRAFFVARWNGSAECEYIALGGAHTECGVVCVRVDEGELDDAEEGASSKSPLHPDLAPFTRIPLISPCVEGKQTFVSHPQVASHLRRQLARFLSRQRDILPLSNAARRVFFDRIEEKAGKQLQLTLGQLAKGLPVYDLQFGSDRVTISCGDKRSVFMK